MKKLDTDFSQKIIFQFQMEYFFQKVIFLEKKSHYFQLWKKFMHKNGIKRSEGSIFLGILVEKFVILGFLACDFRDFLP